MGRTILNWKIRALREGSACSGIARSILWSVFNPRSMTNSQEVAERQA